ncbi:hypothetical protein [Hymenobacter koreensis]|uniref:Uncharacterized protein n=1 Tax=Hymenobacter koreensis TaxID=1084523 RepID=A0ABP8JJI6_9BACT
MNTETDDQIDGRFGKGYRKSHLGEHWQWTLHSWEYYGSTNYVSLSKDARYGPGYRLLIETESGYVPAFVAGNYNDDQVLRLIEGFWPTNPNFKTDRK